MSPNQSKTATGAPVERPKRVRMTAEARREQLLDCAAELLVEGGSEALTMEGLAARAGVNKALPYYHFKTREAVLLDLYEREYGAMAERVAAAVDAADDFAGKLKGLAGTWVDEIDRPDILGAISTVRTDTDVLEEAQRAHGVEATLWIADLMRSEFGMAPDVAVIASATTLSSSGGFLPAWTSTRLSREDAVELYVRMALAAAEEAARFEPSQPRLPRPAARAAKAATTADGKKAKAVRTGKSAPKKRSAKTSTKPTAKSTTTTAAKSAKRRRSS